MLRSSQKFVSLSFILISLLSLRPYRLSSIYRRNRREVELMERVIDVLRPWRKFLSFPWTLILSLFVEAFSLKKRIFRYLNYSLCSHVFRERNIWILVAERHIVVFRLCYFYFLDKSRAILLLLFILSQSFTLTFFLHTNW